MGEHRQRVGPIWVCHTCNYWFRGLESVAQVACPNGHIMDGGRLSLYDFAKKDDPLDVLTEEEP